MFRLQSPVISRTKKHILNEKRHLTDANIEIYLKVDLTDKEFKAAIIKKKKKASTIKYSFIETNANNRKFSKVMCYKKRHKWLL